MAIATQMTVEEYLRTSYPPDCEYVDGEVLDRNVGENDHGWFRERCCLLLDGAARKNSASSSFKNSGFRSMRRHYRVPDLMILEGAGKPKEQILTRPPLVCIEVLSPEDRMSRMQKKVADYLAFGVRYVWVLDPEAEKRIRLTRTGNSEMITDGVSAHGKSGDRDSARPDFRINQFSNKPCQRP